MFDPMGHCYSMSPHPPCRSILCPGSRLTSRPGKCSLGFQQTPWEPRETLPLDTPTPGSHLQTLTHFGDRKKGMEPSLGAGWSLSASPSSGPAPPGDRGVQPALTAQDTAALTSPHWVSLVLPTTLACAQCILTPGQVAVPAVLLPSAGA